MKTLSIASMAAVVAVLMMVIAPVGSHAQCPCMLNCPAGDGGPVAGGPFGGHKTPDLNGDGIVNLQDLAAFAAAWPPRPYLFCADYNCDGMINLVDLSYFAIHWLHAGPVPGYNAPGIDHYKTYETQGPFITGPFRLKDQFGEAFPTQLLLRKFATPVSKNAEGICDTLAHQSWWEFRWPQPLRMVVAQDQFGTHEWMLGDAVYLLLPALKNDTTLTTPLPELNHYLCYEAQGPTMGIQVRLQDQFDLVTVFVVTGRYFCNPCQKETPDGNVYPIVDPLAHLTVYFVDNPRPYQLPVLVRDQFMMEGIVLFDNLFLAVPALKNEVIQPGSSEWNRIKALYDTGTPVTE